MAKNNSYLKFEGTLGGLTYYEKDGKSIVKVKSSVSKSRIEKDPNYKRTRENMQEFGGAAKASKAGLGIRSNYKLRWLYFDQ